MPEPRDVDCITLGRLITSAGQITEKVLYDGEKHICVFGVNGRGKAVRFLIPNLLTIENKSVVVVDPKGELAATTAPYRRKLGRVLVINPFNVVRHEFEGFDDLISCGFNPLAHLNPKSPDFNTEASLLADALVTSSGSDGDAAHFTTSARALLACLIMQASIEAEATGTKPTMRRVRELLCAEASDEPHAGNNHQGAGIPKLARHMMESDIPGLKNKASQFTEWNREIQGIVSTAKIQTEPFDDPQIAADLEKDGFNPFDLRREPMTVYIVLPPQMIERQSKWLRLILTAAFQGVMKARREHEPRTLFMLDEFFALGHMQVVENCYSLVRGYGIQIVPILQGIEQLQKLYPTLWQTFIANAGATLWFAPNDLPTAEYMSRRAGDTTKQAESSSSSSNRNTGASISMSGEGFNTGSGFGNNQSFSPVKVPLVLPHDLIGMPDGWIMATIDKLTPAAFCYAPAHYEIKRCRERARDNPYYKPPAPKPFLLPDQSAA